VDEVLVPDGPVPNGRRDPASRPARVAGLLEAFRGGSENAMNELVRELSPLLWQVARASGLDRCDAEDVVQTVWLSLVAHVGGIRTSAALTSWLVTTTRRESWRVRSAGRRQLPADGDWFAAIPDPQPSCEDNAVLEEQRRQLWAALRELSPRCRELLRIIAFVPRPDYEAVATALGMPRGSIGPTRGRCLAKLRAILDGDGAVE
jgi:RNA polymerase sigma factor (sigma-70 family)